MNTYWFGSFDDSAKGDLLRVFPKKNTRGVGPYQNMAIVTESICNHAGNQALSGHAWLPRCNWVSPEDLVIIITSGPLKLDQHWKGRYGTYRRRFFWFFPEEDGLIFRNGRDYEPDYVDLDSPAT